ncbi:MAG: translation initiation factor IF-2 [Lentisphaerota bacterium]
MRVHEIARDLKLTSKDILDKLHEMRVEAKSHMTALTPDQETALRAAFPLPVITTTLKVVTPPPPSAPKQTHAPSLAAKTPHAAAPKVEAPKPAAVRAAPVAPVAPTAPVAPAEPAAPEAPQKKTVLIRGAIIVKELAEQLGMKPNQLIAELMMMNVFASINERVDLKIAQQVAEKHGYAFEHEKKVVENKPVPKPVEPPPEPINDHTEDLTPRPPIVTFLGHVDHGKTSLLDKIRNSRVALGEDGGITQHIGAYTVTYHDKPITFLDTPGHAAFTAMRARGANLTDVAVVIVAADDGVMPQTKEAIQHARAAKVCIMVAINKIDLRGANIDRVKRQLQQEGLNPEDWGGDIVCCPVSATTGEGIDHLLEMILIQAEMLELKSNPRRRAQGYVVEARLEAGSGPTATLLIRRGTLQVGDAVVCGPHWGKVKALINDQGIKVRTAGPSAAVKMMGLTNVPEPGAEFSVYTDDRAARAISEERMAQKRLDDITAPKRATLEDLLKQTSTTEKRELMVILKTDVQGSLEAIQQSLLGIKSDKVSLKIALAGVGNITGNDVLLASACNAVILGFHVSKEDGVSSMAKREGVEIRLYSIIYEMLDNVRDAMTGLLDPVIKESVVGHAEVRQVFDITKKGRIAGCMCVDGRITSRSKARVVRKSDLLFTGSLLSLKRFQNDASEVREGQECGIRLEGFDAFQAGDIIEFYDVEKIAQQL